MKTTILFVLLLSGRLFGATYYISTTGSDSNPGTIGSPWQTPNHAVNCGDNIIAAAGSYPGSTFTFTFGSVACPNNNNVAWLQCATAFACTISGSGEGISITQSYWGVQGFVVSTTATSPGYPCFAAFTASTHHIIFANNIALNCQGGFNVGNVDYVAMIGNIAYNAALASAQCDSGFSVASPIQSDTAAGTHILLAGNFAFGNLNPNPCDGTTPTDGEGIILDSINSNSYTQQIVVENNMLLHNGGRGIEILGSSTSPIYTLQNTMWDNETDANQTFTTCFDYLINTASHVTSTYDLVQAAGNATCTAAKFAFYVSSGDGTDTVDYAWGDGVAGNNFGAASSPGFSFGSHNTAGTSPAFASPSAPGSPSCGSYATTTACMASVIANFTSANAPSYGYQQPSATRVVDPYFPQWLCNTVATLPTGIVSVGCPAGSKLYIGSLYNGSMQ